jgi:hypothetical protein
VRESLKTVFKDEWARRLCRYFTTTTSERAARAHDSVHSRGVRPSSGGAKSMCHFTKCTPASTYGRKGQAVGELGLGPEFPGRKFQQLLDGRYHGCGGDIRGHFTFCGPHLDCSSIRNAKPLRCGKSGQSPGLATCAMRHSQVLEAV